MTIGDRIKHLRKEAGLTQKELALKCGYTSLTTINKIELGINSVPLSVVEKIAKVFNVSPAYLMGWEERNTSQNGTDIFKLDNILPISTQKIPFLGSVACGEPIYAEEDKESYIVLGTNVNADFCLRAQGDSMIGARIHDGDLVFVRKQEMVDNGEIAVVLIGDDVTLKRVYYYPESQKLMLQAENPSYAPFMFVGTELDQIRILGKAIAFQSDVR
ncbi:MAG: helix-turn-helix domain-containing protein [Clostridia bacterium]|nr:helix-turn-helix domain-containing protein [Clostridia bacterium]